jgi:PKD repeat protein
VNQEVQVNVPITFNASGSHDNVGVVSYEWDFGDGVTGIGVSTTHTYTNSGKYVATLTVVDSAGNCDIRVITIDMDVEQVFPVWMLLVICAVLLVLAAVIYRLKFM